MRTAALTDHHLLLAFEGPRLPDDLRRRLTDGPVPGVTLFRAANVIDAPQVRALTEELQACRPPGTPPLLVAADHEGGQFLGLGTDLTPFAGNLALGAVGDVELAVRVGAAMGREMLAVGANVGYAPNCDLLLEAANPSVGIRSFGDDPAAAGALAASFIQGLRSVGVAATVKHFPGAGAATVDSHHELGSIDASRPVLDARELAVMRGAIAAGPDLVMTGHVAVPALTGGTNVPATLSRTLVSGLPRGELGYEGVVITDALDMHALAQGAGRTDVALAALRAGVDLLLCTPDDATNEVGRAGLRRAAAAGGLDSASLDASRHRIDRLRRRLGEVAAPPIDVVACAEHRALAAELARRSITVVRDDAGLLPVPAGRPLLVLEPRPRDLTPADTTSDADPALATALRGRFTQVDGLVYDDPPDPGDVAAIVRRARGAEFVVLATSAAHLTPAQRELADAVLTCGRPTVLVALRTPHDVAVVPAPTAVCTYGVRPPTLVALADVLVGHAEAEGRLPVTIGATGLRGRGTPP